MTNELSAGCQNVQQNLELIFSVEEVDKFLTEYLFDKGWSYFAYCVKLPTPFNSDRIKMLGNISLSMLDELADFAADCNSPDPSLVKYWTCHAASRCKVEIRSLYPVLRGVCVMTLVGLDRRTHTVVIGTESDSVYLKYRPILKSAMFQLADQLARHVVFSAGPDRNALNLSMREIQILKWIGDGKCSHTIASILGISQSTVNYHIKNIQRKYSSNNRILAVAYSAAHGLI
jgi:LuxR family transcriptional activator of rhlAB and lasB